MFRRLWICLGCEDWEFKITTVHYDLANCFITLGPFRFHTSHFFLYFLLIFGYTPFLSSDSVLLILVWEASAFSFKYLLLRTR